MNTEDELTPTDVFKEDVAEKSKTAKSYYSKGKHQKIPWNNYSRKELKKMNSNVTTYNLNSPMNKEDFMSLPDDVKVKYIKICEEHGGSTKLIATMLGISEFSLRDIRKKLKCSADRGYRRDTKKWNEWIGNQNEAVVTSPTFQLNPIRPIPIGEITLTGTIGDLAIIVGNIVGNNVMEFTITFNAVKISCSSMEQQFC